LRSITITPRHRARRTQYPGLRNDSRRGINHGHSSLTRTTARGARGSMRHFSHGSTVRTMIAALVSTTPKQLISQGCAVIIARSFARIHETNLKVRGPFRLFCRKEPKIFNFNRSKAFCLFGLPTRRTTRALTLGTSLKPLGSLIYSAART
jgi:hypothetical protein